MLHFIRDLCMCRLCHEGPLLSQRGLTCVHVALLQHTDRKTICNA